MDSEKVMSILNGIENLRTTMKTNDENAASYATSIIASIKHTTDAVEHFGTNIDEKLEKLTSEMELANWIALSNNPAMPEEVRTQATNQVIEILTARTKAKEDTLGAQFK